MKPKNFASAFSTRFNLLAVLFIVLALGSASAIRPTQAQGFASSQPSLYERDGVAFQGTALGTAFTYQGRLTNSRDEPVLGPCNFKFTLYQSAAGNDPVGSPQIKTDVPLDNGYFGVALDFGIDAFAGDARYLKVEVDCGSGSYTALDPRAELMPAPYALHAASTGALHGNPVSDSPPTVGNVLAWNGSAWLPTAPASGVHYANVIIVAKSGGDYNTVQAALDSISDATEMYRYLVWVAPGIYNEQVTMKPFVDIEGAGEGLTKLTYAGDVGYAASTVVGANGAELRHLTVENTGGANFATAIYNDNTSPALSHVSLLASEGSVVSRGMLNTNDSEPQLEDVTIVVYGSSTGGGEGIYNNVAYLRARDTTIYIISGTSCHGIANNQSSLDLRDSTISITNGSIASLGVLNSDSYADIWNSDITVAGGVTATQIAGVASYTSGSPFTTLINHSRIVSFDGNTISNNANATTKVGASALIGGAAVGGSSLICAGVYDENYAFYASTCP